jgi:hypothetical protein
MSKTHKTRNVLMNAEPSGVKDEMTDSDELEDLSAHLTGHAWQLPPWPRVEHRCFS